MPRPPLHPLALSLLLVLTACPPAPGPGDGGLPDGGPADAGPLDAGTSDGGPADGGPSDAGPLDAGPSDAGPSDAGPLDAGPSDAGPTDLDWRAVRGVPLQPVVVGEYPGAPFALFDATFALQVGCAGDTCDLQWRDDAGAVVAARPGLRAVYSSSVSPDRRTAALLAPTGSGRCEDVDHFFHDWWQGSMVLLDLATGAVLDQHPGIVTQAFIGSAFVGRGGQLLLFGFDALGCTDDTPLVYATTSPYQVPPALAALGLAYPMDELPDGRLVVLQRPERLALVEPTGNAAPERVTDAAQTVILSGRTLHAFDAFFTSSVTSYDTLAHRAVVTPVPIQEDSFAPETASHRWAATCSQTVGLDHLRRCQVLDGEGLLPRADVHVGAPGGPRPLALAGQAGFFVYAGADGGLVRHDLLDGGETGLGLPLGGFRPVGDGRAVVAATADAVWGIERDRVFAFPGRTRAVLAAELVGARPDLSQSQVVWVVTTSPSGDATWLTAWHVASRRVARLTESLDFSPPAGQPFTNPVDCAVPGSLRAAGGPGDSAFQGAEWLHFTELVPGAPPKVRLLVLPVDLSAPPRLFAELDPGACAPPLASPSGQRLWLPEPTPSGGVRAVFASP